MSKTPRWDALCAAAVDDPTTFPEGTDSREFRLRWAKLTRALERENTELAEALRKIVELDDGDNPTYWEDDAHNAFEIARKLLAKRGEGAT